MYYLYKNIERYHQSQSLVDQVSYSFRIFDICLEFLPLWPIYIKVNISGANQPFHANHANFWINILGGMGDLLLPNFCFFLLSIFANSANFVGLMTVLQSYSLTGCSLVFVIYNKRTN